MFISRDGGGWSSLVIAGHRWGIAAVLSRPEGPGMIKWGPEKVPGGPQAATNTRNQEIAHQRIWALGPKNHLKTGSLESATKLRKTSCHHVHEHMSAPAPPGAPGAHGGTPPFWPTSIFCRAEVMGGT